MGCLHCRGSSDSAENGGHYSIECEISRTIIAAAFSALSSCCNFLKTDKVNHFFERLVAHSLSLRHTKTEVLQVNVGKLCNLACVHCHVNSGPKRKEIMTRQTIDRIIDWFAHTEIPTIDLTGGAPEMNPDFRYFIERVKAMRPWGHVIDRCNLTILLEPGYKGLPQFLADHEVEIIASMSLPPARRCRPPVCSFKSDP